MNREKQYQIVKREYELINYIYYLQYNEENDDITVETADACFMVWESSSFKVNGEECSSKEFYEILDKCEGPVMCNDVRFEKKGDIYISTEPIDVKEEIISSIIQF